MKANTRSVRFCQSILKNLQGANVQIRIFNVRPPVTERFRDVKIVLMNKLYKIKSTLRSQLYEELCKLINDHKSFVEARDNIEILISMVEMAHGLPYKDEDHTTL